MKAKKNIYTYTDQHGSFEVNDPKASDYLYFPLVNEAGLLSAITPDLKGDIKLDQHTFLTVPVSREDLQMSRASRNFWITLSSGQAWSVSGHSVWQRSGMYGTEDLKVEAGFLWHKLTRTNKKLGLQAQVLSFVPADDKPVEIMQITIKNTSKKPLKFSGTSAIPLYGRSADNIRDHRHVTSLLNRVHVEKYGVSLIPTMAFNEAGHSLNETSYFVVGSAENLESPEGVFPTLEAFVGDGGDLEKPSAVVNGTKPIKKATASEQGKESMGALRFKTRTLKPGQSTTFIVLMGIDQKGEKDHSATIKKFGSVENVEKAWAQNKAYWKDASTRLSYETGDTEFNNWIRWVSIQPLFRKIFGCSFLPDFDYGRGGRGWRDLWQDCLALTLANSRDVREMILTNFKGVRMDGSNATIISRKKVGSRWDVSFVADRNNIVRTWMDHGVWPYITTQLYVDQTGDWNLYVEKIPYFRDGLLKRGRVRDRDWNDDQDPVLKMPDDQVYFGTVLEHILVQNLVPFFNVGEHNNIRIEDADWNDGLDMARDKGESVAFTALYAGNMESLAENLDKFQAATGIDTVELAGEMVHLLDTIGTKVDYDDITAKHAALGQYFEVVSQKITGNHISVPLELLKKDLRRKATWIKEHMNAQEWIQHKGQAWFNGYYDNQGKQVEGPQKAGRVQMTLTGQVFPIMAGVASSERTKQIIKSVNANLWDSELGGIRLNSDFGSDQPNLGRAFSFSYGDKENGAIFSHMVVMYANALYQRGFVDEGHRVLSSLFKMAKNSQRSRIYPGLPEYFNNEGRGLYHFLTGSASWYILSMTRDVFGVRGDGGNLRLAPKLVPAQFDKKGLAQISVPFSDSRLTVRYENKKKVPYAKYKIVSVHASGDEVPYSAVSPKEVVIQRELIAQKKEWELTVELG